MPKLWHAVLWSAVVVAIYGLVLYAGYLMMIELIR